MCYLKANKVQEFSFEGSLANTQIGVAITIFPRRENNEFLVATINLEHFDLSKVAKLLAIEDEYEFFSGEWEITNAALAAHFEEQYGVSFFPDKFSYYVGAYSKGTASFQVTRDNFRSLFA